MSCDLWHDQHVVITIWGKKTILSIYLKKKNE